MNSRLFMNEYQKQNVKGNFFSHIFFSHIYSDKKDVLNSIHRLATTTKDLFNNRIDLSKHILISLGAINKKLSIEEQYPLQLYVIQVNEQLVHLLRRVQRLVQVLMHFFSIIKIRFPPVAQV